MRYEWEVYNGNLGDEKYLFGYYLEGVLLCGL